MGLAVIPLADIVLAQIPEGDAGSASGLLTTTQQLGGAIGVAVIGVAVIGVVFFGELTSGASAGADSAVPRPRSDLVATGLPASGTEPAIAQFRRCAHDQAAAQDPAAMPASCQPAAGTDPALVHAFADAGARAREHTVTHAFEVSQWWAVAAVALSAVPLTLLPRRSAVRSAGAIR